MSEFCFCIRLSALNQSANKFRTSQKCNRVKEAGTFFCIKASQQRTMFFCFPIYLPNDSEKPIRRNNAVTASHCRVIFFRSSLTTQRRKDVFFFVDRQLSYSSLSRYSWVLAANDCRFQVKYFLQRSSSFSLASASRVLHDNECWDARQRVYLRNTNNLNSHDSGTLVRGLMDVHAKKTVPQRWSSIAFHFFDLSSSNLLHESL